MKSITKLMASAALAVTALFGSQYAHALAISVSDGVNTLTSTDTDGDGFVNLSSALGSWNFNVVTGFADPAIGSPELYQIHLNSVNASGGQGALTIMITDTDLTKNNASFMTSLGGVTGGTASFSTYISESNTAFALDNQIYSSGSFTSGGFSNNGSGYIDVNGLNGLYSMTLVANITHSSGFLISSFDYDVKVPEPMTLALMGLGLIGIGFASRRKFQA